jgi:phage gp36-like protein
MTYCSVDDIQEQRIPEEILIQLTDDESNEAVSSDVVNAVISAESEIIDGYIRGRYSLPLASTQPILQSVCLDLCTFRLYSRRVGYEVPDHVAKARTAALSTLRSIASGAIKLSIAATEKAAASVRFYSV